MNFILGLLAIIIALVLIILFTPIKYGLEASYDHELEYSIHLRAGFWWRWKMQQEQKNTWKLKILGFNVLRRQQGNQKVPEPPTAVKARKQQSTNKRPSNSLKTMKSFWENKLHLSSWQLLKQVLGAISPDFIQFRGKYGFYEPYFTAWCIPLLWALDGFGNICSINLVAVWEEECLELEVKSSGSILPALLLWYMIRFILQASTLRFFLALKKSRKKFPTASAT